MISRVRGLELAHVMGRLFNVPHMVTPEHLEVIVGAFNRKMMGEDIRPQMFFDKEDDERPARGSGQKQKPYNMVGANAVIPIHRTLVNRDSGMVSLSGMTSYERSWSMMGEALQDNTVRGLLLDIDSPGGEAAGVQAFAYRIRQASAFKPIVAFVNEKSASAAYAIAAGANRIVIPRTGLAGSIGVVLAHVDESAANAQEGLVYTYIHAGKRKLDTAPIPLTDDARKNLQAHVDSLYGEFVRQVSEMRPMKAQAVRDTEAGMFQGEDAVKLGLADEVGTIESALELLGRMSARGSMHSGSSISAGTPRRENDMRKRNGMAWGGLGDLLSAQPNEEVDEGNGNATYLVGERGPELYQGEDPRLSTMQAQLEAANAQLAQQKQLNEQMAQLAARQTRRDAQMTLRSAVEYVDRTLLSKSDMHIAPNGRAAAIALIAQVQAVEENLGVTFYQGAMADPALSIENHPQGVGFEIGGTRQMSMMANLREMFAGAAAITDASKVFTSEQIEGGTPKLNVVNPEARKAGEIDPDDQEAYAARLQQLRAGSDLGQALPAYKANKNGGNGTHASA